ncbi:MAG: aquaporin [Pedosphaera sp.]|nr:aquaporin [Pedosphaera sp.]
MPSLAKQLVAEFIGTFAIVFVVGAATGVIGADVLTISLAQGLTIAALASALMAISGAHFNPAVTVGMLVGGRIQAVTALLYIVMQLVAAFVAAGLLVYALAGTELAIIKDKPITESVAVGTPKIPNKVINNVQSDEPRISAVQGVVVEGALTFLLVITYFGTMADGRGSRLGGLAVGFMATVGVLVGFSLTGAALNPARVFGPAMISGTWLNHWIYWVGPLAGGALAGLVYGRFLLEEPAQPVKDLGAS